MIQGVVNARTEAIVTLKVRGPTGSTFEIDALIDTGYTTSLTLPASMISLLGLPWRSNGRVFLGDGSLVEHEFYEAEIEWDGRWIPVYVTEIGDEVLIGMLLLEGHELKINVEAGAMY